MPRLDSGQPPLLQLLSANGACMPEAPVSPPPAETRTAIRPIILTSHPNGNGVARNAPEWGAAAPERRQPVAASPGDPARRNAIGAHTGVYSLPCAGGCRRPVAA